MSSISDLPTEVLDHIFSYLSIDDQRHSRQVCRQWMHQLSSPRYMEAKELHLTSCTLLKRSLHDLMRAADQGKFRCIRVNTSSPAFPNLSLSFDGSVETLEAVFGMLQKHFRLRHLKLKAGASDGDWPQFPRTDPELVEFTCVTHLEVDLCDELCLELVSSLASQLTTLTLTSVVKVPLVRCLNEIHLPALRSLTIEGDLMEDLVLPAVLGGDCWRVLAQLEVLQCTGCFPLCNVMAEVVRHCQNLKCLALDHVWIIPSQCLEQISALKGLKDLKLTPISNKGGEPPLLQLPNLGKLHLSSNINIRLGKQLPRLTSVVIEGLEPLIQAPNPKAILSQVIKIDDIGERRLRKFHFLAVTLDREANELLGSLQIDLLSFKNCIIDGSILDVLARPDTRRKLLRTWMENCTLIFQSETPYSIRTVAELRATCPYIQIADSETWVG